MKGPWLSLLLAMVHACCGILILIVSSWFIAACAIAPVSFNYVLPAVAIRGLALLRIASGYAQLWLGHQHLLQRTASLRLRLFERLRGQRIHTRAQGMEALSSDTEAVASIWVAWVAQQASTLMVLFTVIVTAFWLNLYGQVTVWLLAACWLLVSALLVMYGAKVANQRAQAEQQFRFESEHFFASSTVWHLIYRQSPTQSPSPMPSALPLWSLEQTHTGRSQLAQWLVQATAFTLLMLGLALAPGEIAHQPLALVIPMLLLASPDWLGRSLQSSHALDRYRLSRLALDNLDLDGLPMHHGLETAGISLQQFSPGHTRLKINVQFPSAGLALLTGSSGSGKSSLLKAMAGLLHYEGARWCGEQLTLPGLIAGWLYVEQSPCVLQGTVRANLDPAGVGISDDEMQSSLRQLGLAAFTELDQWLGTGGRQLSGGEAKRLVLCRALLNQPKVLLVDEPLEGLDPLSQRRVVNCLSELGRRILVVTASHIPLTGTDFCFTLDLDEYPQNPVVPLTQHR